MMSSWKGRIARCRRELPSRWDRLGTRGGRLTSALRAGGRAGVGRAAGLSRPAARSRPAEEGGQRPGNAACLRDIPEDLLRETRVGKSGAFSSAALSPRTQGQESREMV